MSSFKMKPLGEILMFNMTPLYAIFVTFLHISGIEKKQCASILTDDASITALQQITKSGITDKCAISATYDTIGFQYIHKDQQH